MIAKQYVPFDRSFKEDIYRLEKPEYITLGTSHMLVIRDTFFNPPQAFYNYDQVGRPLAMRDWLQKEIRTNPEHLPKLILIGFEPTHFVKLDKPLTASEQWGVAQDGIGKIKWLQVFSDVMRDLLTRKVSLSELTSATEDTIIIGALAQRNEEGTLRDGSYTLRGYPYNNPDAPEYRFAQTRYSFDHGLGLFSVSDTLNTEALEAVAEILKMAQDHDIYIAGFTTPFSPEAYRWMMESGTYGYLTLLDEKLKALFLEHHMAYGNYADPATLGITNEDFHDGAHYDESVAALIMYRLAEANDTFARYIDLDTLTTFLQAHHKIPKPAIYHSAILTGNAF